MSPNKPFSYFLVVLNISINLNPDTNLAKYFVFVFFYNFLFVIKTLNIMVKQQQLVIILPESMADIQFTAPGKLMKIIIRDDCSNLHNKEVV